jgi:hypothetical protein
LFGSDKRKTLSSILRVCVPLLLIALLVYNPFSALITHTDGTAYKELARHRATVGASEMQHFSPIEAESGATHVLLDELFAKYIVVTDESSRQISQEETVPARPELIESIWFRPPPVV